jgi:hypothetical protein
MHHISNRICNAGQKEECMVVYMPVLVGADSKECR